ncbi:MAG: acriflavin resistance protein [Proteobacteria bacterium]|nr:MAG: acriflavin resistance protein [Pseudomonadota bacterium]PIE19688.1 MAG: acriflavin resistance protein [Pseudomonadota bacterium]
MKLADVSIRRPVLATMMVGSLLVFGLFAYPRIGVDLFPNVEFPVVTITAIYPGANPETIETKVIDKLEEAVNTITGIKVLRSTSMENVGTVVIQFELERDADKAVQDVRDKVSAALRDLPKDLDPPVIQKFDVGAAPIMTLVLSGDLSTRELTRIAKDVVKQKLQTLSGVGSLDIVGGRERAFHVWLDPRKLEARGLTVFEVMQALGAQNIELPGGRLNIGNREFILKTRGEVHSAAELGAIIITAQGGNPIRIRDIGRVEDGQQEARSFSSLSGVRAVSLVVRKQSGSNTVAMAHKVREEVEKLRPRLPKGVQLRIPLDHSTFIEHSINDVQFDLLLGGVLAVVIILFFLHDWRATFISALALPTSVIATFAFIDLMGFTFNNMTMLALSLSIGILVDDAIVVIEAIHRHVAKGAPAMEAASKACKEIGLAVMATTASIVAVFVPVAFMQGIIGRFFLQFGLTVAFAVSVSLFVAFTLTPMLAARMLQHEEKQRKNVLARGIDHLLDLVDRIYRRILGWALRHRAITLLFGVASLVGSSQLMKVISTEFIPEQDRGEFVVKIEMPTGTDLETTRDYVQRVTPALRSIPGVELTFTKIGAGVASEVNKAEVQVTLCNSRERRYSQQQAMDYARELLKRFPGPSSLSVEKVDTIAGSGGFRQQAIQFNIRGNDYEELNRAAAKVLAEMKRRGGYVDLDSSYRGGKPELRVDIDRDRAADLGVPVQIIAATLRAFIAGDKVTEIATAGDRYDVRVRLPEAARRRPESITSLRVRTASKMLVPLSQIVKVARGSGPSSIERQDRQRQVTVLANLKGKVLGDAVKEVDKIAAKVVPEQLSKDWAGMADIMRESFGHMVVALILAIIIIYMILAAQFESFIHPFTIMLSLPLSTVGALGALAISGMTLSIFSMIGVIMLMGLVTKNAILLVDYANQLRHEGETIQGALLRAGLVRLRPILMTTAAMIGGMIPVALALSEGGEQRAPMAVVVIGGLITSTLLTLVVVPVVYSLLDGLGGLFRRRNAAS